MTNDPSRIALLVGKYVDGTLSDEESLFLAEQVENNDQVASFLVIIFLPNVFYIASFPRSKSNVIKSSP